MTSKEMPPSEEIASEAPSEGRPRGLVFDFIYQDVRRIGSFLSQFDEHGVRQSIKATETSGHTASSRTAATGTVGVPLIAGGTGAFDATVSEETKDVAEYTFDPLWTNARRLLDYLTEHKLLNTDVWETRLGSFIQIEGVLAIIDPNIAKPLIKLKNVKETIRGNVIEHLIGTEKERNKTFDSFVEFIDIVPSSAQAHLAGSNFTAWCTLSDASLSVAPSDLALKHGSFIPGNWTLVGILDAFPDPKASPTQENPDPKTMDEIVAENAGTLTATITSQMVSVAREIIGRPRNFFGVTPLVIFRGVSSGVDISD